MDKPELRSVRKNKIKAELARVESALPKAPYMTLRQAERLAAFIVENRIRDVLELGCFQGKSTAFIAATLSAAGGGTLTTIDRAEVSGLSPNVYEVLGDLGLADLVTIHLEPRSLTWRLMCFLDQDTPPQFDFCYFDAGHSWDVTGFAFLLVDRLLRPGGWVLFDDLDWTYESMVPANGQLPDWLARIPETERATKQVRKVWEILVKGNPKYSRLREVGAWGFAQKARSAGAIRPDSDSQD